MADVDIKVKIEKDSADFDKSLADSTSAAERLGDTIKNRVGGEGTKAFGDLAEMAGTRLAAALGVVALGTVTLKKSFDFTLESEKIDQIARSFANLSSSVGLIGDDLKDGIFGSARGLADGEDILQASSKALAQLGADASVLPQTMDLARKATAGFGGELVSTYEIFNQALATGNARGLRQYGIIIDQKKAVDDYARSLGVSSAVISESGRRQAVANAILEQSKSKLSNIDETSNKATDAYKRLTVQLDDVFDAFKQGIASSDAWKASLDAATKSAQGFEVMIKRAFGTEDLTTQMIRQGNVVQDYQAQLRNLRKEFADASGFDKNLIGNQITQTTFKLNEATSAYVKMQTEMKAAAQAAKTPSGPSGTFVKSSAANPAAESPIDLNALKQQQAQAAGVIQGFRGQLLSAQESYLGATTDIAQRTTDLDLLNENKRLLIIQEFDLKRQALIAQQTQNRMFTKAQMDEAEVTLEAEKQYRLLAIIDETTKEQQAKLKQLNQALVSTFSTGMTNAIAGFGKAIARGENAFEAFGNSLLDMLGDMAIQVGQFMFIGGLGLQSFYSGNPYGSILYGAALIALGGVLKGFASKGGSSGGGVAAQPTNAGGEITANPEVEQRGPGTSVNVIVQGSVFDSDETGLRIAELLNESFRMKDVRIA